MKNCQHIIAKAVGRTLARGVGHCALVVALAGLWLVVAPEPARASTQCRAPYPLVDKHADMQALLAQGLSERGWDEHLANKNLAVSLVDISTPKQHYYAGVNDDVMLYAASLPKISILLSVADAVHNGRLRWNRTYDRRLGNMIRASSNVDATWGANLVGLTAIGKLMRHPNYCFYDDTHGGMWVGRPYAKGGDTQRDPLFDISHGATSRQAARFYTMLYNGKLVTPQWSARMLRLMGPPEHQHKFVAGLKERPDTVFVARKSGTWRNFHADSAIIRRHGKVYVAVALAETRHGEQLMRDLIEVLDDIIIKGEYRRKG